MSLQSPSDQTHPKAAIARNSLVITIAQVLGVGMGVLFDVLTVIFFGVGTEMDAFFVALAVPQLLFSVFTSIGIRIFTPMFAEANEQGGEEGLTTTFSGVVNYLLLLALAIVLVGIVVTPLIVTIFGLSPAGETIAIKSSRILFLSLLPIAIIEPIRAIWVLQKQFFLSSLFYFLRYGGCVIGLVVLKPYAGVFSLAWAYVLGSILPLLVYLLFFVRFGNRYRLVLGRKERLFSQITSRLGPPMLGELIGQSNIIVERLFASFLPPGAVSIFGYGRRVLVALNGLINNSIVVAILPRLSREAVARNIQNMRQTIFFGTQLMALVVGYIAILLVAMSGLVVNFMVQQEIITPDLAHITTLILISLAPTLFIAGMTQILMAPFFALGETKIILYLRLLFLLVNFLISFAFFKLWGADGLVIALVVSLLIQACLWFVAVIKRLQGLDMQMYTFLGKFILASIVISGSLYYFVSALEVTGLPALLAVLVALSLVVGVLMGMMALWLKVLSRGHLVYAYQRTNAFLR